MIPGPVPMVRHEGWANRFPRLAQGTTVRRPNEGGGGSVASGPRGRTGDATPASAPDFDLGRFGQGDRGPVARRWALLARATGFPRVVHGRQVHGARVVEHGLDEEGFCLVESCDGHVTVHAGVLLTVAGADCAPVFLATDDGDGVALLHAGWRGTAAGVLEAGVEHLCRVSGRRAAHLHAHMGPAICATCYEVGPEVHRALGLPDPGRPRPVDLRAALADRASRAGVESVTVSSHCTLCGDAGFFSHRGGDSGRHLAVLGMRPRVPG